MRRGIEDGNRCAIDEGLREIAGALQRGGHGSDVVEGIVSTRAEVIQEERGRLQFEKLRNLEWATDRHTVAILRVLRLGHSALAEREGRGVERGISELIEHLAVQGGIAPASTAISDECAAGVVTAASTASG